MTHQERELVWLTRKVTEDEAFVERLEDYVDSHHREWSKVVTSELLDILMKVKDQLYYEQHRLEKLAWKIHAQREEPEAGLVPTPN